MANSALVVSSLDYDTIRSNLVSFLKSQTQFNDYNYEGSNLSQLIDLLSYNTYMNNFYTNMAVSEMFLDSAQILDSVVSRAKELNYTPRSNRSAVGYIDITVLTGGQTPDSVVIPSGTAFNARIGPNIYTFTTPESIIVYDHNNYTASNVAIYEGTLVTETYSVNTAIINKSFVLSNPNIDTSSLVVTVQNSSSDTTTQSFLQATTMLGYGSNSAIYFVEAAAGGNYKLVFGDGTVGQALINGNIISATYRVATGSDVNGAGQFTLSGVISSYGAAVNTELVAYGGANSETIASIKYNAPRHYQTQDRAITTNDYSTILMQQYPDIRAIHVYGGETVYPPQYGKVFISIDFNDFTGIPTITASNIESFIKTKMPLSFTPVVIAPDYTYIYIETTAQYNINVSTLLPGDVQTEILNAVENFNSQYLEDFNITFRYSKLAAAISDADSSIVTSNLITKMIKRLEPTLSQVSAYNLNYYNSIIPNSIISTGFVYGGVSAFIQDDGAGNINMLTSKNSVISTLLTNIGTIDYNSGVLALTLPALDSYIGNYISVYAQSVTSDFSVINNTVLQIDPADINITVTAVRV